MRGRWRQENGFKHGVERWGINQLDRRSTEPGRNLAARAESRGGRRGVP
jgi:hypothetical protein